MRTSLRIAVISMHSSPMGELGTRDTGGMSVYVGEIARRLASMGHAVDIFTRIQSSGRQSIIRPFEGVRVIHLAAGPPEPLSQTALHGCLGEFFENMERFRRHEGASYDLVHSHYYLSGQIGLWARKLWHAPLVFTAHTLGTAKNRYGTAVREPEWRIAVEERVCRECDLILAGTEREKSDLVQLCGALPQRVRVVPCGVDLDTFRPLNRLESRAKLGLKADERVLLYVGRFDPIKGVDRLIEAVSDLRREISLRLLLVGGGGESAPEDRSLRALCARLSLDGCVTFEGRRAHGDLPDYYRAADALVLPSYYESFGLVVLEALACGTPVVATRVGIVEDIVRNGVNGGVVSESSAAGLAKGIHHLLGRCDAHGVRADAIHATVRDYDWNTVAERIDLEYRMLTGWGGSLQGERKEERSERQSGRSGRCGSSG